MQDKTRPASMDYAEGVVRAWMQNSQIALTVGDFERLVMMIATRMEKFAQNHKAGLVQLSGLIE